MPTQCGPLSRAKAIRLTRLDECGVPVDGLVSVVSSTSFVSITTTPVYTDQEDIQITNANGDLCIDDQSDVALRWLELNILLCNIDPDAVNIITGAPLVVDDTPVTPNTVGFNWDSATDGSANFALEVWSGVPGQPCDAAGFPTYGYWLYPFVVQSQIQEYVAELGGLQLSFTARTSAGSGWGVGPFDVRRDAVTPFGPEPLLTAIGATTHGHFEFTTLAPPTPVCGATALPA